tara:strand:+ start:484 stop:1443 length:960 start_codon:yes stop_codon:yes gene_type:complete
MSRVDNTGGSGFTTDNGTGLVVRTKLNQIIAALSTLNQGSGDPTIGVAAYVPHIDGNTLKIRNAANNAFVSLGDVSATNFGHAGLSAANTFTSTNIFQEDVTFDGATAGRDVVFDRSDNALEFADNAKAKFGTGEDLSLYHNGTNSFIENTTGYLRITGNSGQVYIQSDDDVRITGHAADESMARFHKNGAVELYHDNVKKIETASGGVSLTGGAAANITALSDGATITIDMATACHHSVTLGGNRTFAAPSNQVVGQAGSIFITQDGTGSRTASFNSAFKFVGGTAPTLTTTAAAVDRIDYIILSSNVIHCAVSLDVK